MINLILASGSKQRKEIFDCMGLKYKVIKSNIAESSMQIEPDKYVMELSLNKANAVESIVREKSLIIACDSIIYMNNKKYEKPKTKVEAFNNIIEMKGKSTHAYTGVTIIDTYKNKTITYFDKAELILRNDINKEEIQWYVDNEENILERCGYTLLGKGIIFIDKVIGDYNTIFGISASSLIKHINKLGYSIKDFELK
ncbi:MAG: Maf family nucleotide pyrophosphatase [Bacilli bacterium]|nr:Maf family nucleotide pyrophosphatase [Bacilli bacterium]MDD4407172.1 Maf family nucleotide pyrophosphatase [Bacilli bacterium]